MKRFFLIFISSCFLSACATEKNIPLDASFWNKKSHHKVAVVSTKAPKPEVITVGNQGLLDMAINHAMAKSLSERLDQVNLNWYATLPGEVAGKLKSHHMIPVIVSDINNAKNEALINAVSAQGADEILIIRLNAVGTIRQYTGFIPLGAPKAYVVLKGTLYDASGKTVLWRHLADVKIPVEGEWDQAPNYPNLMTALNQAISTSRQEIIDSFFSGRE